MGVPDSCRYEDGLVCLRDIILANRKQCDMESEQRELINRGMVLNETT